MKSKHPRRHNAIEMNLDDGTQKQDEASVIARGRACVRTEQYRHSEVMRSVGRSHIQRCVRVAAAQAMYDHATTAPRVRCAAALARPMRRSTPARRRPTRTSQGISSPTPCMTPVGRMRRHGHQSTVAYRGANGPLLLTKQAQHSTISTTHNVCLL